MKARHSMGVAVGSVLLLLLVAFAGCSMPTVTRSGAGVDAETGTWRWADGSEVERRGPLPAPGPQDPGGSEQASPEQDPAVEDVGEQAATDSPAPPQGTGDAAVEDDGARILPRDDVDPDRALGPRRSRFGQRVDPDPEIESHYLWRMPRMQTGNLPGAGQFEVDYRLEGIEDKTASGWDIAQSIGLRYGLRDRVALSARFGTGTQVDTLGGAQNNGTQPLDPGSTFDFAVELGPDEPGGDGATFRMGVLLAEEGAFDIDESVEISFQPSLILNSKDEDGTQAVLELGMRLHDGADPAYVVAAGVSSPLDSYSLFLEFDSLLMPHDGVYELYLTPGIAFQPRDRIQFTLSPSIGLNSDTPDWRVMADFSIRF